MVRFVVYFLHLAIESGIYACVGVCVCVGARVCIDVGAFFLSLVMCVCVVCACVCVWKCCI